MKGQKWNHGHAKDWILSIPHPILRLSVNPGRARENGVPLIQCQNGTCPGVDVMQRDTRAVNIIVVNDDSNDSSDAIGFFWSNEERGRDFQVVWREFLH